MLLLKNTLGNAIFNKRKNTPSAKELTYKYLKINKLTAF